MKKLLLGALFFHMLTGETTGLTETTNNDEQNEGDVQPAVEDPAVENKERFDESSLSAAGVPESTSENAE